MIPLTVRITKQQQQHSSISLVPIKLLTIPTIITSEKEIKSSNESQSIINEENKYERYLLSFSSLSTWGYPLPLDDTTLTNRTSF